MIDVVPVSGRAALRDFIDFPYRKYRGHPYWVPPLRLGEHERFNPKKNPFYEHADIQPFLARKDNRTVGRIAAIDDRAHEAVHHDDLVAFGFLEADERRSPGRCCSRSSNGRAPAAAPRSADRSTRR